MRSELKPTLKVAPRGGICEFLIWGIAFALMCSWNVGVLQAKPLALKARLVWGTDGPKPPHSKLKDLDKSLVKKLRSVFRWKNYFRVRQHEFEVTRAKPTHIRMSRKCVLEIRNFGKNKVEVKLFGEGRLVVTKRQTIVPGELMILAGDDKNETAWFIVLNHTSDRPRR